MLLNLRELRFYNQKETEVLRSASLSTISSVSCCIVGKWHRLSSVCVFKMCQWCVCSLNRRPSSMLYVLPQLSHRKTKNAHLLFDVRKAKCAKIGQSQKLCSRTILVTCELTGGKKKEKKTSRHLKTCLCFGIIIFWSSNASSIFAFPDKHHKCKM